MNDISECIKNCNYHLYADDVQLYIQFPAHNYRAAIADMNYDLTRIIEYSNGHNLKLNVEKTQPIMIGSPAYIEKIFNEGIQEIIINGISIPLSANVKNLGVIFDCHLSWEQHVTKIVKSVLQELHFGYYKVSLSICR